MKKKYFAMITLILSTSLLLFGFISSANASTEKTNYEKAIIGYWGEGDSPFAVAAFLEGGVYKGWVYEDRTKATLFVKMEGKWWIDGEQLHNELTNINPPIPEFEIGKVTIDQIIQISKKEMILIDDKGKKYSNFKILDPNLIKNPINSNDSSSEELSPQKKEAIRELMQVTGAYKIGKAFAKEMTQQTVNALKNSNPDIDPRVYDILNEESQILLHEELLEKETFLPFVYEIYHKYLSIEEIKDVIQFYKTPSGRKTIAVMPKIMKESVVAGQKWDEKLRLILQQRIIERIEKEGIDLE